MIYKSLKYIPIFNFFEAYETKDRKYILHEYNSVVNENELNEAYGALIKEYHDRLEDEGNNVINKYETLVKLKKGKALLESIVFTLKFKYAGYDIDFIELENELKNLGINLIYKTEKEFYEALGNINLKKDNYNIARVEKELESMSNNNKTSYREAIARFRIALKIDININRDTMEDFFIYKKMYKQLKKAA